MKPHSLRVLALSGLTFLFAACGGGESGGDPSGTQVDAELVQAGQQVFAGEGTCFTCHGADGRGVQGLAPDLTDSEWVNIEQPVTVDKIEDIVLNGVQQPKQHPGAMPAMGQTLSDDKINAVASYVYSLSQR